MKFKCACCKREFSNVFALILHSVGARDDVDEQTDAFLELRNILKEACEAECEHTQAARRASKAGGRTPRTYAELSRFTEEIAARLENVLRCLGIAGVEVTPTPAAAAAPPARQEEHAGGASGAAGPSTSAAPEESITRADAGRTSTARTFGNEDTSKAVTPGWAAGKLDDYARDDAVEEKAKEKKINLLNAMREAFAGVFLETPGNASVRRSKDGTYELNLTVRGWTPVDSTIASRAVSQRIRDIFVEAARGAGRENEAIRATSDVANWLDKNCLVKFMPNPMP